MPIIKYNTTAYINIPYKFKFDLSNLGWASSADHDCFSSDQMQDLLESSIDNDNMELNNSLKDIIDGLGTFKGDIVFSYYKEE